MNAPRASLAPKLRPPVGKPVTREMLLNLPKTDLHCHLDGSLRLDTMMELSKEQGVGLPGTTKADLARALHVGENCKSLDEYLQAFSITLSVLQTDAALERCAFELAED